MSTPTLPTTYAELTHRLQHYKPWQALSPCEARSYLEQRLGTYRLLGLYQTFFPTEFALSTASAYESFTPNGHSHLELEFLRNLDILVPINNLDILVPINDWTVDWAAEEKLSYLPISDMGIDIHEGGSIETLNLHLQYLLSLSNEGRYHLENVDGVEWYEAISGLSLDQIQHPDQVPITKLRQRFNKLPAPIRFLPLILSLLDKSTGNLWLDATENEDYYGESTSLDLTEANLHLAIRHWKQAQVMIKHCGCFIDWLKSDLPARFTELLTLWNPPYLP